MLIKNEEYGFTYVIPDDYKEIPKERYEDYNIDESTLGVFVKTVGGEPHTISLNRDADTPDEKTYEKLVKENASNMKELGMEIVERVERETERAKIDVLYSAFQGLRFATYFTVICGMTVACSSEITEKGDENDKAVAAVFESLSEI